MQTDNNKARLKWHCRRGMLELDLILIPYFERYYDSLSPELQLQFQQLLGRNDPELYAWLLGSVPVTIKEFHAIVQHIKTHLSLKTL